GIIGLLAERAGIVRPIGIAAQCCEHDLVAGRDFGLDEGRARAESIRVCGSADPFGDKAAVVDSESRQADQAIRRADGADYAAALSVQNDKPGPEISDNCLAVDQREPAAVDAQD